MPAQACDYLNRTLNTASAASKCHWWLLAIIASTILLVALGRTVGSDAQARSLEELLLLLPVRLSKVPVTELNPLCAQGLCVANEPEIKQCLVTGEIWAHTAEELGVFLSGRGVCLRGASNDDKQPL